jgi:hypothetical protein
MAALGSAEPEHVDRGPVREGARVPTQVPHPADHRTRRAGGRSAPRPAKRADRAGGRNHRTVRRSRPRAARRAVPATPRVPRRGMRRTRPSRVGDAETGGRTGDRPAHESPRCDLGTRLRSALPHRLARGRRGRARASKARGDDRACSRATGVHRRHSSNRRRAGRRGR